MITMHQHPDNVLLCHLRQGRKKQDVYWHPRKDKKLRMAVDNLGSFNTEKLRDKFKLSYNQMKEILQNLKRNQTPEGNLQTKFRKLLVFQCLLELN